MANKSLFAGFKSLFPRARARNEAGGLAYALPPKHALAQIAATGCFNGTFYAEAEDQLETLRALIAQVNDNPFLAKLAIYSRERAFMKDMPAFAPKFGTDVGTESLKSGTLGTKRWNC